MTVHKKIKPIRSSRLAGQRKHTNVLFYYKDDFECRLSIVVFYSVHSRKEGNVRFTKVPIQVLSDHVVTGSRRTFEFPSRVNLSGTSLYCIARTLGNELDTQ